ncbi:MAG TPA: hypothetical protein VET23_08710 [Chitinophagaceae bacterium]|nr:hypothetical protein [Chitinophagaceae bacterium]
MKKVFLLIPAIFCCSILLSQQPDSADNARLAEMINLSEVVIRSDLDVGKFIERIKTDTTFYKAFRNLHLLSYTSLNDIRLKDKKGNIQASLQSKTRQNYANGCRTMDVLEENTTGDFYDDERNCNYYTGKLYSGLFFTNGKICGENNIVKGIELDPGSKTGIEKHEEQLKILFFNPGKKIPGIPFIGNKIDIFDPRIAQYYDFNIDKSDFDGQSCYIFSIKAKSGLSSDEKNEIVIDSMVTWFNAKTMEIVARNYDMSYDAGVYNFDVHMEVQMTRFSNYLVPKTLRYTGNWKVIFKKKERGFFTATLFDFK